MANMMQFGDFSSLDVLATAASLQSACLDSDSEGENGGTSGQGGNSQETAEDSAEKDGDVKDKQVEDAEENNGMVKDTQPPQLVIEGSTGAGTDLESSGFITDLSSPVSDTLGSPFSESEVFTPPPPVTPLSPGPATKSGETEKSKPACVVKLLDGNGSKIIPGDSKTSLTLKDATKIVLPTKQGPKTMTVIKINKQEVSDHSYAFLCQLQKLRSDEDEGYSSRSSVESEGEGEGHPGSKTAPAGMTPGSSMLAVKTATGPSPQNVAISGKKQPKILIVGKDKNLQKIISTSDSKQLLSDLSAGNPGGSIVLRTLLGPKTVVNPASTNGKHGPVPVVNMSTPLEGSESLLGSSCLENDQSLMEVDRVTPCGPVQVEQDAEETVCTETANSALSNSDLVDDCPTSSETCEESPCSEDLVCDVTSDSRPTDPTCVTIVTEQEQDVESSTSDSTRTVSGDGSETELTCKPLVSVEGCGDDDEEVTISVTIPGTALTGNLTPPINMDQSEVMPLVTGPYLLNQPVSENCISKTQTLYAESESLDNSDSKKIDPQNCSLDNVKEQETNCALSDSLLSAESTGVTSTEQICVGQSSTEIFGESDVEIVEQDSRNVNVLDTSAEERVTKCEQKETSLDLARDSSAEEEEVVSVGVVGEEHPTATPENSSDSVVFVDNTSLINTELGDSEDLDEVSLLGEASKTDQTSVKEKLDSSESCTENETEFSESPCKSQIEAILADEKSCAEQKSAPIPALSDTLPPENCEEQHVVKPGVVIKNQYIIEDDVPPVTKFSSVEVQDSSIALLQTDLGVTSTTSSAPVEVMKLLGKPALTTTPAPVTASNGKLVQKGGSIIHVIPVSGNGSVVAPPAPAVGTVQYITRVPGSSAVVPGKLSSTLPTTVLVPVAHPQALKLAAIPRHSVNPAMGGLRLITGSATTQLVQSPVPRDCTSPSFGSTRSEPCSPFARFGSPTKSLCSPDLGRRTPEITGRATPLECLDKSPGDVINVKINGGQILKDSPDCTPSKKGPMSIGKMGSLSWKPLEKSSELVRLDQVLNSQGGSGRQRLRIQGSEISSKLPLEDSAMDAESESGQSSIPDPMEEENSKDTVISDDIPAEELRLTFKPQAANRTVHSYVRRNRKAPHEHILFGNEPDMSIMRKSALSMSHLHPLIDHDYCMFTEFNAQIQSSIIATTECKAKTERKYTKKSKAARTNVAKSNCATSGLDKVERVREVPMKAGRGRPKKRIPEPDPEPDDTPIPSPETPDLNQKAEEVKVRKQTMAEKKALERNKRVLRDGRHYVKITGSYQDEFVYFATKKTRGRRGNQTDSQQDVPVQPATVGGISVFDWYKDLSNSDKNYRFGIPTAGSEGDSQPGAESFSSGYLPPTSTLSVRKSSAPDRTPIHESEVVDLVCELSGFGGSEKEEPATSFITNDQNLGVARVEETGSEKLDLWAEQLSNMLTSMNEDEKQQLFQQLGDSGVNNEEGVSENEKGSGATVGLRDTSFDSYLTDFHQDSSSGLSQGPEPSQLCDLDDINDNDLIPTEIGNMNAILGDLKTNESRKPESDTQAKTSGANLNVLLDSNTNPHVAFNMKLDKSELFPDMSTPDQPAPAADLAAPELTVVSMYWNDLPGLLINQKEHVRLVDIHKQVLPAKDTGILKKRCQMMGLEILNCSELQRDFLIRYANAAKSKSTVIVSKASAKTLIGFYVDPKPKVTKQMSDEQKELKEVIEMKEEPVVEDTLPTMVSEAAPSVKEEVTSELEAVSTEGAVDVPSPLGVSDGVEVKQEEDTLTLPVKTEGGKGKSRKRKVAPPASPVDPGLVGDPEYIPPLETNRTSPVAHVLRAPLPAIDLKRSARLKHKKVRYDKMVQGTHYVDENDNEEQLEESPVPSPPPPKKSKERRIMLNKSISKESDDSEISEDHENRDVSEKSETFPEEMEIRKLKAKSRRRRLSNKDKKRLRRLREKVRRKQMRRKVKFQKKPSIKIDDNKIIVKIPQKSKKKLQETHVYTKKYNQEHCYAACPENFKKEDPGIVDSPGSPLVLVEKEGEQLTVGHSCEVQRVISVEESTKECSVEVRKRPPLEVVHRDSVHRNAQRGHSQDGDLHIQLFKTRDSPCIQCLSCMEFLSLKSFIKHMHLQDSSEELLEVTLPQKLELRNSKPTEQELGMWDEFQKIQKGYSPDHEPKLKSPIVSAVEAEIKHRDQLAQDEVSSAESSIASATRHSTRVRKRKQLHPIEKYVFSKLLPVTEPPEKKGKYDPELEFADTRLNELESKLLPSEVKTELERMGKRMGLSVSPIRAVRVKKDTEEDRQVISKYDLRISGQAEEGTLQTRRQKVLTRRNRNIDGNLTALEQEKD